MNATNIEKIIVEPLSNPACAFYTGAFMGGLFYLRVAFAMVTFSLLVKAVDKLAITPLLDWIKSKLYRK